MEEEFTEYLNIDNKFFVKETFPAKPKKYVKFKPEEDKADPLFINDDDFAQYGPKADNLGAARMDLKHAQNLVSIKNMVTTLYPNLQKPNITKV